VSAKLSLVSSKVTAYKKVGEYLWLNQASGYYYVKKTFKRYRIPALNCSTKEKSIRLAKAKAEQLVADHMAKYLGTGASPLAKRVGVSMATVIDEILETVTPLMRLSTQENHKLYLGELRAEWGAWDVDRITRAAWFEWLKGFRRRKSRGTFGDYQKYMNLILRYAHTEKHAKHLVTVPNPDAKLEKAGRVFTRAEIKALWAVMNEETRDQFTLCFECFMRLREALHLTWERVDLKSGIVTLRAEDVKTGSKTGKGRSFRVSEQALERLKARARGASSPYVFPSPTDPARPIHQNKDAWKRAKRKAKIAGRARWHDLRHTALSWALLDSKSDPVLVSEYAGVSLRTIQQVYLHSTADKTRAVASAVRIHQNLRGEKGMKSKKGARNAKDV